MEKAQMTPVSKAILDLKTCLQKTATESSNILDYGPKIEFLRQHFNENVGPVSDEIKMLDEIRLALSKFGPVSVYLDQDRMKSRGEALFIADDLLRKVGFNLTAWDKERVEDFQTQLAADMMKNGKIRVD